MLAAAVERKKNQERDKAGWFLAEGRRSDTAADVPRFTRSGASRGV